MPPASSASRCAIKAPNTWPTDRFVPTGFGVASAGNTRSMLTLLLILAVLAVVTWLAF
jgi:hypothetical protein